MPGPPARTFVPDDDDVTRLDGLLLNGLEGVLLAVEHARRPAVLTALGARELQDRTLGGEVAEQNHEAAARLERTIDRADHLLSGRFDRFGRLFRKRPTGDRRAGAVDGPGFDEPLHDEPCCRRPRADRSRRIDRTV